MDERSLQFSKFISLGMLFQNLVLAMKKKFNMADLFKDGCQLYSPRFLGFSETVKMVIEV